MPNMISNDTVATINRMAKEMNTAIMDQEGYNPVGEEWLLKEFLKVCSLGYTEGYEDGFIDAQESYR